MIWDWLYWGIGVLIGIRAGNEYSPLAKPPSPRWGNWPRKMIGAFIVFLIGTVFWPVFAFIYFLRAWIKK